MSNANETKQTSVERLDVLRVLETNMVLRLMEQIIFRIASVSPAVQIASVLSEPLVREAVRKDIEDMIISHRGATIAQHLRDVSADEWVDIWATFHALWRWAGGVVGYKSEQWVKLLQLLSVIMECQGQAHPMPYRGYMQVSKAHDMIDAVLRSEVDIEATPAVLETMSKQRDVLCWILKHNHNEKFSRNLVQLETEFQKHAIGPAADPNAAPA